MTHPLKTITLPDGRTFKFGRRQPVKPAPQHLCLSNYLTAPAAVQLPRPKQAWDYTQGAATALGRMYLNDAEGDCVIAAIAHAEGVYTAGETGTPVLFTDRQINSVYSGACGYVVGRPQTDQGCDIQTVLSWWQQRGFVQPEHKIIGFLAVDATHTYEVVLAGWLFKILILGLNLPDAYVNPAPETSGFVWRKAGPPVPENGHCIICAKGGPTGLNVDTWGMNGTLTWAAVNEYLSAKNGGEMWIVLTQELISHATGLGPGLLNWQQLQADYVAFGQTYPTHRAP